MKDETIGNAEYIDAKGAAALLGVSRGALSRYPITYRQYMRKSKAMYKRSDVLEFMQKSIHSHNQGELS